MRILPDENMYLYSFDLKYNFHKVNLPCICISRRNVSGELMAGYIVLLELITALKGFPTQFITAVDRCPEESGDMQQLGVGNGPELSVGPFLSSIHPTGLHRATTTYWTYHGLPPGLAGYPTHTAGEKSTGEERGKESNK